MSTNRDHSTPPRGRLSRMADRGRRGLSPTGLGRARSKLDDLGMLLADGEARELLPGIVIDSDGRIAPGDNATDPTTWVELAKFAGSAGRLLWDLARDDRVPARAKVVCGLAAAYVVSPLDVVPDFIPTAGRIDDIYLVARSLRYLVDSAGYEVLTDLWTGSDEGLALIMGLVGVK
ncbi:YkvA family protein [Salsipaludibacter albus]|uniref:YkvA family protein n=1 Tax=Salsipaludibacter albus TaxID=2849650 RepID=UPI001EE3F699|nr:DUF1232 domain-containing protein [Salsipaludibacter albus]MBY5163351.1 DUF1232 domain-containing protein [Salsipaludibacter albus]